MHRRTPIESSELYNRTNERWMDGWPSYVESSRLEFTIEWPADTMSTQLRCLCLIMRVYLSIDRCLREKKIYRRSIDDWYLLCRLIGLGDIYSRETRSFDVAHTHCLPLPSTSTFPRSKSSNYGYVHKHFFLPLPALRSFC